MSDLYQGRTVLLTGATSGIGREMARSIARHECRLVLVSRRADALDRTLRETSPGARATIVCRAVDLAEPAQVEAFVTEAEREALVPDILVNNAGRVAYGYYHKTSWDEHRRLVALNITAPMMLMHWAIPHMCRRGEGWILNVGSVAGTMPGPYFATYAATKAFLNSVSVALTIELESKNIHCATLLPGNTGCPGFWGAPGLMRKVGTIDRFASPADVARTGLRLLESDRAYAVHGISNQVKQLVLRLVPRRVLNAALRHHSYREFLE